MGRVGTLEHPFKNKHLFPRAGSRVRHGADIDTSEFADLRLVFLTHVGRRKRLPGPPAWPHLSRESELERGRREGNNG